MLNTATILASAAAGKGATPPVPTLTYTAQNQFTISAFDSNLTYTVTNGTRSGSVVTISSVGTTATVSAKYSKSLVSSATASLLTAAYARVLTSVASSPGSEGCGPRGDICCPSGTIQSTAGNECGGAPGTQVPDGICGNTCPGNCFGLYVTCWNWRWNNYSTGPEGTGYTLIGNTWGKVT